MPFLVPLPVLLTLPLSRSLHGRCMLPAHRVTIRRFNAARPSLDVRHRYGAFSARPASSISVGCLLNDDMINRNVIKCNHLYRQLPSSALCHPFKHASNVGERAPSPVVIRPPSISHSPAQPPAFTYSVISPRRAPRLTASARLDAPSFA
jgi:hypothetical protein